MGWRAGVENQVWEPAEGELRWLTEGRAFDMMTPEDDPRAFLDSLYSIETQEEQRPVLFESQVRKE